MEGEQSLVEAIQHEKSRHAEESDLIPDSNPNPNPNLILDRESQLYTNG